MKQLLVEYTPEELDWSVEEVPLQDAPPSMRLVESAPSPATEPSLPRFDLDEADDSLQTPLATPALPADAWPYDFPASSRPEPTVSHESSYVGALPQRDAREAVVARHVDLARSVSHLESICEKFDSVDPSASAAETSLRRRVGALAMCRRALTDLVELTDSPKYCDVLDEGGLASAYVAGIYLWLSDVTEALTILANQLNDLTPQWSDLRSRLDEVAWIYDMAAAEQAKLEARLDREDEPLAVTLDEIFASVASFKVRLAEPFG
jgi:hypothetical protein